MNLYLGMNRALKHTIYGIRSALMARVRAMRAFARNARVRARARARHAIARARARNNVIIIARARARNAIARVETSYCARLSCPNVIKLCA